MVVFVILLILNCVSCMPVRATTLDPRFQLSFDGFVMFLKELPALRGRFIIVAESGKSLSNRIDVLEAGILKTNKSIPTPKEKMNSIKDNMRHLELRLQNITGTVRTTKQNMAKLNDYYSETRQRRINLTELADNVSSNLADMHDVIDNVTSAIAEINNTTNDLKSNRFDLLQRFEGISKKADIIELLGCDSGFGYVDKSWPQMSTLRYSHPFNATPSTMYSVTRLGILHGGNYDNSVNVTTSNVTKSGMSVTVDKARNTQLRESEYNWMVCSV